MAALVPALPGRYAFLDNVDVSSESYLRALREGTKEVFQLISQTNPNGTNTSNTEPAFPPNLRTGSLRINSLLVKILASTHINMALWIEDPLNLDSNAQIDWIVEQIHSKETVKLIFKHLFIYLHLKWRMYDLLRQKTPPRIKAMRASQIAHTPCEYFWIKFNSYIESLKQEVEVEEAGNTPWGFCVIS